MASQWWLNLAAINARILFIFYQIWAIYRLGQGRKHPKKIFSFFQILYFGVPVQVLTVVGNTAPSCSPSLHLRTDCTCAALSDPIVLRLADKFAPLLSSVVDNLHQSPSAFLLYKPWPSRRDEPVRFTDVYLKTSRFCGRSRRERCRGCGERSSNGSGEQEGGWRACGVGQKRGRRRFRLSTRVAAVLGGDRWRRGSLAERFKKFGGKLGFLSKPNRIHRIISVGRFGSDKILRFSLVLIFRC